MADRGQEGSDRPTVLVLDADIVVRSEIPEYLRDCGDRGTAT
jgi:hypothetical protein